MFGAALCASIGYSDIAVLALLALCLIFGIIRGFSKTLKGFMVGVAVVLCSLYLTGLAFAPAQNLSVSQSLEQSLASSSEGWGEAFTTPVYSVETGYAVLNDDGATYTALKEVGGFKGVLANWLADKFEPQDSQTVAEVIVGNIANLILSIILFALFAFALSVICALLRRLTQNMHTSENRAVRALNKVLGGVLGAGLAMIFVLFVFAIFASLEDKMPSVISAVKASPVSAFFYNNNPVGSVLTGIFN
jgi:uncharacterized membrane protein required for colicin V production